MRQGRTDAWIAHQLEVTVQQIQSFKREQELDADGDENGTPFTEEVDLRAEDDAAIAVELEEEEERRRRETEAREAEEAAQRVAEAAEEADAAAAVAEASPDEGEEDADEDARPRRRRRGGGRTRRRVGTAKALEGTFDHGEEGYGL